MSQTATAEQLTNRVTELERTTLQLQKDMGELRRNLPGANGLVQAVDQATLSAAVNKLFADLGITAQPKGVAYLRQMFEQEGVAELDLTRQLIEARDE